MSILVKLRKSILLFLKTVLITTLVVCFLILHITFFRDTGGFFFNGYYVNALLYAIILISFSSLYGALKFGVFRLSEIIYSFFLSIVITNIIAYIQMSLLDLKFLNAVPFILLILVQMLVVLIFSFFINKLYFIMYPAREIVAVISGSSSDYLLLKKMQLKKDRYKVCGIIEENCDRKKIFDAIGKHGAVLLCNVNDDLHYDIFSYCNIHGKRLYVMPSIRDVMIKNAHSTQVFDTPLYYCKNAGLSTEQAIIKRFMDIVISAVGLIILFPVMVIVAIAIKLEDGGPILFRQERLTRNSKVFKVIKFRSMVIDAEKDGKAVLAEQNDNRITKVGKIIRMVRIDELPQLINILLGQMSVVGPRPERPEIAKEYEKTIPEFIMRLSVKAGLTGYAQIHGRYNTSPQDKLLLDLMYTEGYSLMLDMRIILMTIKILFMPESTQGIEKGTELPLPEKIIGDIDIDKIK